MLEGVVSGYLSEYIGRYFRSLTADSLRVAVLSGQVTLENLELEPAAFDGLDLPFKVRHSSRLARRHGPRT